MGRSVEPTRPLMRQTRPLAVIAAAFVVGIAAPAGSVEALHGETAITCMNPNSGATWQIKVDYDRRTVDSNPASISDAEIKWRDASDGWNYTLDRKSGALTVILASATGGNMLFDRCKLDN
jgi:hypothetical protein